MLEWLNNIAGPDYVRALLWTILALVLLVVVLAVVKLIRSMTFGTFVAGGRNRKTRLAVMDAAPVDSQRRLVLIRRDDIEHLLLIGGPTDVVVERDIRMVAQRRPTLTGGSGLTGGPGLTGDAGHQPAPTQRPQPQQGPAHHGRPQPSAIAQPQPGKPHEPARLAIAPQLPPVSVSPSPLYPAVKALMPKQKPQPPNDIDDDFLDELDVSLDDFAIDQPAAPASKAAPSLDDEMTKLLGELAHHKKQQ